MTEESAEERYNRQLAEEVAKIQAYRKSVEEEFSGVDVDDPETAKIARNKLFELVPDAAETIATLLLHAESESVRGTLAKFVFTEAMRAADKGKTADAWETLFKKLQVDVDEPAEA
jgi:hypothetical protein